MSTDRTDLDEPIVFSTTETRIIPCSLEGGRVATATTQGEAVSQRNEVGGVEFRCFSDRPEPGDVLLIGLDKAVPNCAVLLRVDCRVSGVGVDPTNPPYVWEAWTGGPDWVPCELGSDETKAFNKPGDVILHVPAVTCSTHHRESVAKPAAGCAAGSSNPRPGSRPTANHRSSHPFPRARSAAPHASSMPG